MIKTILGRPMAQVGGASRFGFKSLPVQAQRADNKLKNLQAEQRKMIVGSMLAADPISSALKQRGNLIASRIAQLKGKLSERT